MSVATLQSNASPRDCQDDRMRTFNEVQQGIKHFFAAFNDSKRQRSATLSRGSHGMEQYFTPSRLPPRPAGPPPPENLQRKQSTSKLTTVSLTTKSPVSPIQNALPVSTSEALRPQSENPKLDNTDLEGRGRASTTEKKPASNAQESSLLEPSLSASSPTENVSIPKHIHVLGIQGQTEGHSLLNPIASRIEEQSTNKHSSLQSPELTDQPKSEIQQTQITTSVRMETIRTSSMTPRVNEVSWIDSDVAMEVSVQVDKNSPESGAVITQVSASSMVPSEETPLQTSVAPENKEISIAPLPTSSVTRSLSAVSDGELIENENENEILKTIPNGIIMEKSFVIEAPANESDSEFHMAFVDNYLDQIVSPGSSESSTVSSIDTASTSLPIESQQVNMETSHTNSTVSATSSSTTSSSTSTPTNSSSSYRRSSFFNYFSRNKENTSSSPPSTTESNEQSTVDQTSISQEVTQDASKEDDDDFIIVDGAI